MTTVNELREFCEKIRIENDEGLKSVLDDYFENYFLARHKPWRAVIGNKRCKPIPIHRDFKFVTKEQDSLHRTEFQWPNMSEENLRKELTNLGFVVTGPCIAISVPPCKKGQKLSYAQEWVKKINYKYSVYCKNEKELAKEIYAEFLSDLLSFPKERIKTHDEYTLFCNYKHKYKISSICYSAILRLMENDGIEELYEDGEYKGIKVLRQPPN